MEDTKPQGALSMLDAVLPRMWKEWLISVLLIVALLFVVGTIVGGAAAAFERVGVILAKVPLITIGGLLGYYGDRGLFPYARPGDLRDQATAYLQRLNGRETDLRVSPQEVELLASFNRSFDTATLRRAIIVAASILGASLAA